MNRYSQFLRAGKRLKSTVIAQQDSILIGYQRWWLPIWKDRTLIFSLRVQENPQSTIAYWVLIPQHEDQHYSIPKEIFQNSIRMVYGAGYWECKPLPNGKTQLTHRIFMDPAGSLPAFLMNTINKTGIVDQVEDVVQEAKRWDKS
ncbi:MAG: hypothetical protein N2450_09720 [bacterium]|nr:hypothetical protein [bacterium]